MILNTATLVELGLAFAPYEKMGSKVFLFKSAQQISASAGPVCHGRVWTAFLDDLGSM